MKSPSKLAIVRVLIIGVLLLVSGSRSLNVFATRLGQNIVAQMTPPSTLSPEVSLPLVFSDEFDGNKLDPTKWEFSGTPIVSGGKLRLCGDCSIQSKAVFQHGVVLQAAIESSDWKSQGRFTDSSFGFEIWAGANGRCHYGVVFKASGHLGVLRSQPDANNRCFGNPLYQAYPSILSWEVVRAAGTVYLSLTWSSSGVTLYVSDGDSTNGRASYKGMAEPTVPLKIRLHAATGETYLIDYIRVYQCP